MGFYDRIVSHGPGKIAVHDVAAIVREIKRGNLTNADAPALLTLDAAEAIEFDALRQSITISAEVEAVWDALYLGERGVAGYATGAELEARVTGGALKPMPVVKV